MILIDYSDTIYSLMQGYEIWDKFILKQNLEISFKFEEEGIIYHRKINIKFWKINFRIKSDICTYVGRYFLATLKITDYAHQTEKECSLPYYHLISIIEYYNNKFFYILKLYFLVMLLEQLLFLFSIDNKEYMSIIFWNVAPDFTN